MIKLLRPPCPPSLERRVVTAATTSMMRQIPKRSISKYRAGERSFTFRSEYYGHDDVKERLKLMQHKKCAFCESSFEHISYGDVEHFRPKGGWVQEAEDELERPGYYWLAYDWENLFLSCQLCNQRFKKNLFPLVDPSKRARTHHDHLAHEEPLLIDPARDEPDDHIYFDRERIRAWTEKGATTIRVLGLDRRELNKMRQERYAELRLIFANIAGVLADLEKILDHAQDLTWLESKYEQLDQLRRRLEEVDRPEQEYAAMKHWAIAKLNAKLGHSSSEA